ncbi:MAG: hypothetical protein QS721_03715 [Candidatus Endonucleobacter sp. (ex Gigantidas childressi)]|nr:hypothetical protein [Candidatus Endonucleobacter sp. (ex Gigantidas childressi)]
MLVYASFAQGGGLEKNSAVSPDIVANYLSIIYGDVNCSKLIDQIVWSPLTHVRPQLFSSDSRNEYTGLGAISMDERILRFHRSERAGCEAISMLVNMPCIINSKCIDKNGEVWDARSDPADVSSLEGEFLIYPSTIAAYMFALFNAFKPSDFKEILEEYEGDYLNPSDNRGGCQSEASLLKEDSDGAGSSGLCKDNISILSYENEPYCRQREKGNAFYGEVDAYFKCAKKLFSGILTTLLKYENHARHRDTTDRVNYLGVNMNYYGLDFSIALSPREVSTATHNELESNESNESNESFEPFNIWQNKLKSASWKSEKKVEIKSRIQAAYPNCPDPEEILAGASSMGVQELIAKFMELSSESCLSSKVCSGAAKRQKGIQQNEQSCGLNIYLKNSSLYKTKIVTPECIAIMFGDTDLLDVICGKRPYDVIDTSSRGFKLSSLFSCLSVEKETKLAQKQNYWAVKNDWKHPFLTYLDDEYKKEKASFNMEVLTLKDLFYVLCGYINDLENNQLTLTKWACKKGIFPKHTNDERRFFNDKWRKVVQNGSRRQAMKNHNIFMLLKGSHLLETVIDRSCRKYIDDNFEYCYDRAHTFNRRNGWDSINTESGIYERCAAHEYILRLRHDVEVVYLDDSKKVSPFKWLSGHRASPGRVKSGGGNRQPIINRSSRKKRPDTNIVRALHL